MIIVYNIVIICIIMMIRCTYIRYSRW